MMLSKLSDPLNAGGPITFKEKPYEIRKPTTFQIYKTPVEAPKGAGYSAHILNNTVT